MPQKHVYFICIILTFFSSVTLAKKLNIVFVNPGHPSQNMTGNFWSNVTLFMQAAADDLNIELTTIYAHRNHILMRSLVDNVIAKKPDYVVLVNEKAAALPLLKSLTANEIPVFMLLNSFNHADFELLTPKERTYLRGSIVPNNYEVGKFLMAELLTHYSTLPNVDPRAKKHVFALQGDYATPASLARESGLRDALAQYSDVELLDSSVAAWSADKAYQKVIGIAQRHPIHIIWAANDAMAFGAKKAMTALNVNYPYVVGGINWDISDNNLTLDISYGGHVVLGAFALVMLRDIDNGDRKPPNHHLTVDIFESSLSSFARLFKQQLMNREFARYNFAKFCLPSKQKQPFTIEGLIHTYEN